ncbi:MAG: S8 family serine peptidase, partial [Oscillospiraceae bacterium]
MKIAVIDDGINPGYYPNIGDLCFDLKVNERNKIVKRIRYDKVTPSHGTTCAAIIKKYAPTAQIGSIKMISDDTFRGKANHLITALEWCVHNDIKLVHMSIGSSQVKDIELISVAVTTLLDSGCSIVAALTNTMKFSVPACLEGVFGVKTSDTLENEQFDVVEGGLYDVPFIASSKHALVDYMGIEHITPLCNSYSAPLITAQIHNILEVKPQLTGLKIRNALGLHRIRTYQELIAKTQLISQPIVIPIICVTGEKHTVLSATSELNQ